MSSMTAPTVMTEPSRNADALIVAYGYGELDNLLSLLDGGVHIDAHSTSDATALGRAAECSHLKVERLLVEREATVDLVDQQGSSAMGNAASHNYVEIIHELLEAGANANDVNNHGASPLHLVPGNECVGAVAELLARGVDIEKANMNSMPRCTSL